MGSGYHHDALHAIRHRRSSPLHARASGEPLLVGPGGRIVAAEPAKDDPRITGLLPEDLPSDDDPGGDDSTGAGERGNGAHSPQSEPEPQLPTAAVGDSDSVQSSAAGVAAIMSAQMASTVSPGMISTSLITASSIFATAMSSGLPSTSSPSTSTAAAGTSTSAIATTTTAPSLRSSSTSSSTSSSASISSSQVPTSSAISNAASSSPSHTVTTHLGIAVGGAAGVVSLIALVVWFVRIRSRARRKAIINNSSWPWDRDDEGVEPGLGFGGGGGGGFGFRSAWVAGLDEPKSQVRCPDVVVEKDHVLHSADHVTIEMGHSPYPTVQVPNAHGSVPDLAPDLGRLLVANFVPGDVYVSSGESSRVTSRANSFVSLGSRRAKRWTPPPLDPIHSGLGIYEEKEPVIDVTQMPHLPFPGGGEVVDEVSDPVSIPAQDGWAANLRTNVVNVFQSVFWNNAHANGDSVGASFTATPIRHHRGPSTYTVACGGPLSLRNSIHSKPPTRRNSFSAPDPAMDYAKGADPQDLADRLTQAMYGASEDATQSAIDLEKPAPAFIKTRDRTWGPAGSLSRESSVYSTTSHAANASQEPTFPAFELPEIPTVSRSNTDSSFLRAVQGKGPYRSKSKRVARVRGPRPSMLRRTTSKSDSGCSTSSMDSNITQSTSPRILSEGEQYAQRILRERRRRVTAAKLQNVKHSLRRPTARPSSKRKVRASLRKGAKTCVSP